MIDLKLFGNQIKTSEKCLPMANTTRDAVEGLHNFREFSQPPPPPPECLDEAM